MATDSRRFVALGAGCAVAIALAVVAVGAGIWAYVYYTSPRYSLRQVKDAVDRRDVAAFEKYVDIRGICDSGVDRYLEQMARAREGDSGGDPWGRALGAGLLTVLKPAMVEALQTEIREAVAEGRVAHGESKPEVKIVEVTRDSRGALVWLLIPGRSFDPPRNRDGRVQIRMVDRGRYWQAAEVVALEGFAEPERRAAVHRK